jgi:phage terminase large subunit
MQLVINDVYLPHLENMSATQIFYGGAGSGKSRFLSQRPIIDVLQNNRNYLVCRKVQNTIRKSVFNEIEGVIDEAGLRPYFTTNKTEMSITASTGNQILFAGLDNPLALQGVRPKRGVVTDLWVDEATETDKDDLKVLSKRLRSGEEETRKRMIFSFNPIYQGHWLYDTYFSSIGWATEQTEYNTPDLSILKTWYIHNRFLTKQDVENLLNEKDEYYRNVYTFGNWGVLGDVIFTNWEIQDLSGMRDQFTNRRNGLDFGFASHPAAVSVSHYDADRKTIYIYDELYETGLTNDLLAEEVKRMVGNEYVVGDSAEPKSIVELQNHGASVSGAKKGKDSITFGVDWLKQQRIIIDKKCVNHIKEFQQYQWKKDASGNAVTPPKPVDKNNHLIDALRYAYEGDMSDNWYMI